MGLQEGERSTGAEAEQWLYHHGLVHGEVRQQHVVLHDITGNLPEGAQVSGLAVDQDLPLHPCLSVHRTQAH